MLTTLGTCGTNVSCFMTKKQQDKYMAAYKVEYQKLLKELDDTLTDATHLFECEENSGAQDWIADYLGGSGSIKSLRNNIARITHAD